MVQINFARKEVNCKIVYYGCGLSGKTTNLEIVHEKAPGDRKGELTSIATEGDRTLFFDFMPLDLGKVGGMSTKFQLYTVPGQVYYNATRKLVLQGADGIVFVADSQRDKLEENLRDNGLDIRKIPLVIQYNKRDLPNVMSVEELEEKINIYDAPSFEAVAITGEGVFPTLKKLSAMVLAKLNKEYGVGGREARARAPKREKKADSGEISSRPAQPPKRSPDAASSADAKVRRQSALESVTAAATMTRTEPPVRRRREPTREPAREPARTEARTEARARKERAPGRLTARRRMPHSPASASSSPAPASAGARGGERVYYLVYVLLAFAVLGVVYLLISGKLNEWIANL